MCNIKFQCVKYESPLYYKVVNLREIVLRKPLGLKFTVNDLTIDASEQIYALTSVSEPIACVQIRPILENTVKLRQMAVAPTYQGHGYGKQLLNKVESVLKTNGIKNIELHARKTAIPFYLKNGYKIISGEFSEVGIPHLKMKKTL